MLSTVILAPGTPMLLGGDEFGRTQAGNNNPYCQDDETSWWDWARANSAHGRTLTAFVTKLIAVRRRYPALRWPHFMHGRTELASGLRDIAWFDANGSEISHESWKDRERPLLCLRRVVQTDDGAACILNFLLNPSAQDHYFILPAPAVAGRILIDSAQPDADDIPIADSKVGVRARSAVLIFSELERPSQ